jgi:hypothetical protein
MANQWLRLWHDMPTDPKFGTVARVSGEHITVVLSVYMHMLVDASRNVTRGHVTVTAEDLATALNVTDEQIEKILAAMNGRLIVDGVLSGWDKRQVKREDSGDEETGAKSSAQRKKEQREREKQAEIDAANLVAEKQCHDLSRNVTLDKDKDKEKKEIPSLSKPAVIDCPHEKILDAFAEKLPGLAQPTRSLWRDGKNAPALKSRWAWLMTACHEKGKRKGERMATTEAEGVEWFGRFFAYVADSDFLMGRSSEWSCDLIWLVNKSNFEKVIQGSYENQKAAA